MNKEQAIHNFWSSFGWKAYEENTVDPDAKLPYITYNVATGEIDEYVGLYATLWDRGTSHKRVDGKAKEIAQHIVRMNPIPLDDGYLHLSLGSPFSQHQDDEDDMIRRTYINLQAEFYTEF